MLGPKSLPQLPHEVRYRLDLLAYKNAIRPKPQPKPGVKAPNAFGRTP